ncbi:hypothetical protein ANTQUA_LOCUS8818 [Anthophora quadrimaculata]
MKEEIGKRIEKGEKFAFLQPRQNNYQDHLKEALLFIQPTIEDAVALNAKFHGASCIFSFDYILLSKTGERFFRVMYSVEILWEALCGIKGEEYQTCLIIIENILGRVAQDSFLFLAESREAKKTDYVVESVDVTKTEQRLPVPEQRSPRQTYIISIFTIVYMVYLILNTTIATLLKKRNNHSPNSFAKTSLLRDEETKQSKKKKKKKRSDKEKTDSPVARLLCTYRYGSSSCALKASRLNLAK